MTHEAALREILDESNWAVNDSPVKMEGRLNNIRDAARAALGLLADEHASLIAQDGWEDDGERARRGR